MCFLCPAHTDRFFVISSSEKKSDRFLIGPKVSAHEPIFTLIGPCALGITNRQLSAQEAVFKMCGLPLRSAGRDNVTINTSPTRVLKPSRQLYALQDESSEIFEPNMFDRYMLHPDPDEFNMMSLHDFVSKYKSTSNPDYSETRDNMMQGF